MKARRLTRLLCVLVVGAAVFPASASSGTTIGESRPAFIPSNCPDGYYIAQVSTVGPPNYTVPPGGGVITSWTAFGQLNPGTVGFVVWRPTLVPNSLVLVARTPPVSLTEGSALPPQPVRIPVVGFETIGVKAADPGGTSCFEGTAAASDTVRYAAPATEPAINDPVNLSSVGSNTRIMVSAVVEPDADRDGFGDETQDQCPTDIAKQGPCVTTTGQRAAALKKCKKKKSRKARRKCKRRALKLPV